MMVFDVAHPGERVDEGDGLEPALERERLLDRVAGSRQLLSCARWSRTACSLIALARALALLLEEIGHGAIGSGRRATSAARRSTAGGCE